jgi:hypothetical protein
MIGNKPRCVVLHDCNGSDQRDLGTASKNHALTKTAIVIDGNDGETFEFPRRERAIKPTHNFGQFMLQKFFRHDRSLDVDRFRLIDIREPRIFDVWQVEKLVSGMLWLPPMD